MHGSSRRYSGYDEYEGIFGPLGASTSARAGSRSLSAKYGRSSSSSAAATSFGTRAFPASRRQRSTPVLSTNGYERRQRYLTDRAGKRRVKTVDVEHADEDDEEQRDRELPRRSEQQQIWLPAKNFTFRQRAGKLDTRTIARLDLEKIVATTDVEAIQRHLENVAFSDVTLEDVQQYSDAYFLKLFQIAQLTLEYLLNVQDSLASHCENLEAQCEGLASECQSLEVDNQRVESEIVAMKKEIRQKQSTLATFEMMLLNATAAKRANQGLRAISQQQRDEENDSAVLNVLGGPIVNAGDGHDEAGAVPLVSSCVLCGKKFISPEYLLRHQHKKHGDYTAENDAKKQSKNKKKKKSKRSDSSSGSDSQASESDSERKKARTRREPKTAPLPAEVIQALNERNELSKQLMELQFQLRSEKERRVEEAKAMEHQQAQLTTQLTSYMARLQDTLVEMEKKQEQSKHEMMRYTQETIDRLKSEQAERVRDTKKSHAGRLESDGESESDERGQGRKPKPDGSVGEVERRLLDSLLRTQAETQQKNSELEQANRRLQNRLKRRARQLQAEPPLTTLMSMAALDAQRFGIDVGAAHDEEKAVVRPKTAVTEDKPVQTDEEKEMPSRKVAAIAPQPVKKELPSEPAPVMKTEPKLMAEPLKPLIKKAESTIPQPKLETKAPPPPPKPKTEEKQAPVEDTKPTPLAEAKEPASALPRPAESKSESKLQHAAHVVGKVALGFLARRVLKNPSNWLLTLPASSLHGALSENELAHLTQSQPSGSLQDIMVEIEDDMTANDLRVAFAEALSGKADERDEDESLHDEIPSIDYHRVLLHHRLTGQEISGDQFIYHLRNQLEVEIIPRFDEAESHVDAVLSFHGDTTSQLQEIRRASMDLTPEEIGRHTQDEAQERRANTAVTRIQSVVRRFLAVHVVEMMKIDRLVEARLLSMSMSSTSRPRSNSVRRLTRSASVVATRVETTDETAIAGKAQEIHERLADLVKSRTGVDTRTKSAKWSRGRLSTEEYERHVEEFQRKQAELPVAVQTRIQQISERVDKLVENSYDPESAKKEEDQYVAASKIQLAIQVGVARKKLKQLLGLKNAQETKSESEATIEKEKVSASTRRSESEAKEEERSHEEEEKAGAEEKEEEKEGEEEGLLDVEELDASEINRLADAYEQPPEPSKPEAKPSVEAPPPQEKAPAVDIFAPVTRARTQKPADVPPRPGTPPPTQEELAGRSPRPQGDAHVISPFSKTPLLSRRAPASRRGSGYDNAR